MGRVKKGEKYWYIASCFFADDFYITYGVDFYEDIQDGRFALGNYFRTKEEAEAMAKKLRAVLKGADVIEIPSEEDASFESAYLLGLSGHDGDDRTGEAYLDGFADCLHWLKSEVK